MHLLANLCSRITSHDFSEHGQTTIQGGADYNSSKFHGGGGAHVTAEHVDHGDSRDTFVCRGVFHVPKGSKRRSAAVT